MFPSEQGLLKGAQLTPFAQPRTGCLIDKCPPWSGIQALDNAPLSRDGRSLGILSHTDFSELSEPFEAVWYVLDREVKIIMQRLER